MQGGCACETIRFEVELATAADVGYCHCRICQRSSGAPVMVFATVPRDGFRILAGTPRVRASTSFGERLFCADCGTQLAMRVDDEPSTIDVSVVAFDDPAQLAPTFHIWDESRIAWFATADALPRHARRR